MTISAIEWYQLMQTRMRIWRWKYKPNPKAFSPACKDLVQTRPWRRGPSVSTSCFLPGIKTLTEIWEEWRLQRGKLADNTGQLIRSSSSTFSPPSFLEPDLTWSFQTLWSITTSWGTGFLFITTQSSLALTCREKSLRSDAKLCCCCAFDVVMLTVLLAQVLFLWV